MSQLKSILLAIDLATRQRDAAVKNLAELKRKLEFSKGQMDQLTGYASDTDARWTSAPAGMMSGEMIRHHYQFMGRLQHAIQMQSGVIEEAAAQVEGGAKELLKADFRLAGLNQVLDSRRQLIALTLKRREQRATDEFASLAYIRKRAQMTVGEPT
jgi:flagellar FliJ protein